MSSEWKPVELQQYLTMLRERWVSALVTAILVLGAVVAATMLQTPSYQSTSRLFVQTQTGSNVADLNSGVNFASQQITTYADLTTSPLVLTPVVEELSLDVTSQDLSNSISTTIPPETLILEITASSEDPSLSADIANATAESLQSAVAELEANGEGSTVELTVISPAEIPASPASPSIPRNFALGAVLALIAAIGVVVLRAIADNRVRTSQDIEKNFERPVIAAIPASRDSQHLPLIAAREPQSLQAEAYRELRTNLQFMGLSKDARSVLVTSSLQGEGKSSSAINLAHVLAKTGGRVLLIDADLRRPSTAKYLGLEGNAGLTTVLIGEAEIADLVQPLDVDGLEVLTSGPIPPNPSELLGSAAMEQALRVAMTDYDFVVLDSAPLLAVTDAAVLSQIVGGTLIVAQSERVKTPQLRAAFEKLAAVDARVLGVVLNRVPRRVRDAYFYTYRYEPDRPQDTASTRRQSTPMPGRRIDAAPASRARRKGGDRTPSATTRSRKRRSRSRRMDDPFGAAVKAWPGTSDADGQHQ